MGCEAKTIDSLKTKQDHRISGRVSFGVLNC